MANWIAGTCTANGVNVRYLRTGGDRPPILLLHGLMLNGACWTPLARELERDYNVIMPDARGHGNSDAPDQGYRYEDLAADVIGLINALGLVSPVLLGHSMGGMTAAVVASQTPKQLRGLVLVDPPFLTPKRQHEVYASDVADQHRLILSQPKEAFLAEMQSRRSHRSREVIELFVQARFQTSLHAFKVLTPPNPDYKQLINALDVPSLLVIGDAGSIVSSEMASELAKLNQRLKVVQIEQAGHAVPFDLPARFLATIQTFLSSVST